MASKKIRQALNLDKDPVLILISEFLSPGAKDILREEKIGFYEIGGSLYLPAPGAYIYVEKPPAKSLERKIRSLFSTRRSQVIHALLLNPETWFGVHELADLARTSPANVSEALIELERLDWIATEGKGPNKTRKLSDPKALLDTWAREVKGDPKLTTQPYYVPGGQTTKVQAHLERVFSKENIEYAITGEAAAQHYTPFLTSVSNVHVRL